MSPTIVEHDVEPWRRWSYLPAYRVGEAARYAGVSHQMVSYWLRGIRTQQPKLSERPSWQGLSYYELVEVAFVATFRGIGIPFKHIRIAHDHAAKAFGSEYPFVEHKWLTEGPGVMLELREMGHLKSSGGPMAGKKGLGKAPPEEPVVWVPGRGAAWNSVVKERFAEFDYEDGIAVVWRLAGRESLVVIDPRMSFGTPTVGGLPTWVLKGRWEAGESIEAIIADYRLKEEEIRDGLVFEGVTLEG